MILDASTPRCQGRWVTALGTGYLARECTDCVRRTDAPADVKAVPWMQPPAIAYPFSVCPSHMAPVDEVVV